MTYKRPENKTKQNKTKQNKKTKPFIIEKNDGFSVLIV